MRSEEIRHATENLQWSTLIRYLLKKAVRYRKLHSYAVDSICQVKRNAALGGLKSAVLAKYRKECRPRGVVCCSHCIIRA